MIYGRGNSSSSFDPRAYIASHCDSNEPHISNVDSTYGTIGHFSQPQSFDNPQSSILPDSSLFVDSEATNHITSNLNNLSLHAPYNSNNKVSVGNGKKLPISHVGLGHLNTHTQPASIIPLSNVLHVPNMTKNLISVSQPTRDHDLVAEFNSSSCLIKDKNSGLVLLRGFLKDGLYQLH